MNNQETTYLFHRIKTVFLALLTVTSSLCHCSCQQQAIAEPIQVIGKFSLNMHDTISLMHADIHNRLTFFEQQRALSPCPSMLNNDLPQTIRTTADDFLARLRAKEHDLVYCQKKLRNIDPRSIRQIGTEFKQSLKEMHLLKKEEKKLSQIPLNIPPELVSKIKQALSAASQHIESIQQEERYQSCFNIVHTISPEYISNAEKTLALALLRVLELNENTQKLADYRHTKNLAHSLADTLHDVEAILKNSQNLVDYRNTLSLPPASVHQLEQDLINEYHHFCQWYTEKILFFIQFHCRYKQDALPLINCPCKNKDKHSEITVLVVDVPTQKMTLFESNTIEWNGAPANPESTSLWLIPVCSEIIYKATRLFMINSNGTVYLWLLPQLDDDSLELQLIGRTQKHEDPLLRIVTETSGSLTPLYVPLVGKIVLPHQQKSEK